MPEGLMVVERLALYLALFSCGVAGFIVGCWATVVVLEGRCPWCQLPPWVERVRGYRGPGRPSRPRQEEE